MKYILILFMLFSMGNTLYSQTILTESLYFADSLSSIWGKNIYINDDGNYLIGQKAYINGKSGASIAQYDYDLNMQWINTFYDERNIWPITTYQEGSQNIFLGVYDTNFGYYYQATIDSAGGFVHKTISSNSAIRYGKYIHDKDKKRNYHFFSQGYKKKTQLILRTYDLEGNMLEETEYPILDHEDYDKYHVEDAIQISEDQFVIYGMLEDEDNDKEDVFISKVNLSGNILWQQISQKEVNQEPTSITHLDDNSFIILGGYVQSGCWDGKLFSYIRKLDQNGNELWEKNIHIGIKLLLVKSVQLSDGSLICAGWKYYMPHPNGFFNIHNFYMIKIDSTGRKIWEKEWGEENQDSKIYDMIYDKDGTLVITGHKGCSFYIARVRDDYFSVDTESQVSNLTVYPNPAQGEVVYIQLNKPENLSKFNDNRIDIINELGQIILSQNISYKTDESATVSISIKTLANGIYYLKNGNSVVPFVVRR